MAEQASTAATGAATLLAAWTIGDDYELQLSCDHTAEHGPMYRLRKLKRDRETNELAPTYFDYSLPPFAVGEVMDAIAKALRGDL